MPLPRKRLSQRRPSGLGPIHGGDTLRCSVATLELQDLEGLCMLTQLPSAHDMHLFLFVAKKDLRDRLSVCAQRITSIYQESKS